MTFEEFFYRRFLEVQPTTEREYLPVLWSCLYYARHFRADGMKDLQQYLDRLDRRKKYFTVVVYDGGIHENLGDLDIEVYSAVGGSLAVNPKTYCGRLGDVAIPILCRPSPGIRLDRERDVLAGFIGADTHPIRDVMHSVLSNVAGFSLGRSIINPNMAFLPMDDDKWAKVNYEGFKDLMEQSIFALCPRGSSTTSFRVCESLQYGCVPVYISDEFWYPWSDPKNPADHGVFDEIGVTCTPEQLPDLPARLRSMSRGQINQYLANGRRLYQTHFSFEGAFDRIIERVNHAR